MPAPNPGDTQVYSAAAQAWVPSSGGASGGGAFSTKKVFWFSGQNLGPGAPTSSLGQLFGFNSYAFASGTLISHPVLTGASRLASTNRVRVTAVSPGVVSMGFQDNGQLIAWRGIGGSGGFLFVCRFAFEGFGTPPLDTFIGLQAVLGPAGGTNWVTDVTIARVGLAFHTAAAPGGNWQMVESTGGATTAHDLGAPFPIAAGDYLEVSLTAAPSDNKVVAKVSNLTTGAIASLTLNTTLPPAGIFMAPYVQCNVQAGGAGSTLFSISQMYLECADN